MKAPEALSRNIYSEKTDVWAFGVTMVEIFTREAPYPNEGRVAVAAMVSKGELIPNIPDWLSTEMQQFLKTKCFAFQMEDRATFKEIVLIELICFDCFD